jgi:hypothetical protein
LFIFGGDGTVVVDSGGEAIAGGDTMRFPLVSS